MNPAQAGFYVTGGTVAGDASCYVPRKADQELYDGLRRGEFCYVLTSRQMGKSSLMVRTAKRLRAEGATVVVLDLTAVGQNLTAEQWYDGLLVHVGRQLGLEDELEQFWLAHERLGVLQRWMRALREVVLPRFPGPLVIFVDEIDAVRGLPFSTDEFFAAIRECYNRRTEDPDLGRLTFCLLGVATPSDLIKDTRTTPFNIGHRIELHDFAEAEAAPLAQGLGREPQTATGLLGRVLHWTGGHPYLTQRLCRAVAEDPGVRDPAGVDRVCTGLFLSHRARERDDNLLFVRDRILRSEADRAGLLDLYAQVRGFWPVPDQETNPLVSVLRLSGIVRVDAGRLRVRNRIYHRVFDGPWVQANMPDAEVRRQRAAFRRGLLRASAVAAAILAIVGGLAWLAFSEARQRDQEAAKRQAADQAREESEGLRQKAEQAMTEAEEARQKEAAQREKTAEFARKARDRAVRLDVGNGTRLLDDGDLPGALVWFADALALARAEGEAKAEREDVHRLRLAATLGQSPRLAQVWFLDGARPTYAEFSPDGSRVLAAADDGTVLVWPRDGEEPVCRLKHAARVNHAAFSPDGKLIVTASEDKTARVWDAATGQPVTREPLAHNGSVNHAEFSPRGKRVVTASTDRMARIWDTVTGQLLVTCAGSAPAMMMDDKAPKAGEGKGGQPAAAVTSHGGPVYWATFSPDGKLVATAGDDKTAQVWDAATGRPVGERLKHPGTVRQVVFSPDGQLVATADGLDRLPAPPPGDRYSDLGGAQGVARLWKARTGEAVGGVLQHAGKVNQVVFSPDGTTLFTAADDRLVKAWRIDATGDPSQNTRRSAQHPGRVSSVACSPDGHTFATACSDRTARVWLVSSGDSASAPSSQLPSDLGAPSSGDTTPTLLPHGGPVSRVVFSPDGRWLLTAGDDRTVRVWDLYPRALAASPSLDSRRVRSAQFSADGRRFAQLGDGGMVTVYDTAGARPVAAPLEGASATAVWLSGDGRRAVTGDGIGTLQVWDVDTGGALARVADSASETGSVALGPDGRLVLTVGGDSRARLWNADTGQPAADLGAEADVIGASFSPDGGFVILSKKSGLDQVRYSRTGQPAAALNEALAKLHGETTDLPSYVPLVFSPDGRRLATAGPQQDATVWDAATGAPVARLRHLGAVREVRFSPDGRRLATTTEDNVAWVWDVPAEPAAEPLDEPLCGPLKLHVYLGTTFLRFSPDGNRLVTADDGGVTQVWDALTGEPLTPPLRQAATVAEAVLDDRGRLTTITNDGTVRAWDLALGGRLQAEDLFRLVRLETGRVLAGDRGRFVPVEPTALQEAWRQVRAGADAALPAAPPGAAAWHRYQVAQNAETWDWAAALWHLDRLIEAEPSSVLWAHHADVNVKLGRFDQALADYDKAARMEPPVPTLRWDVATVHKLHGDAVFTAVTTRDEKTLKPEDLAAGREAYEACRQILGRLPPVHRLTVQGERDLHAAYLLLADQCVSSGNLPAAHDCLAAAGELLRTLPDGLRVTAQGRRDQAEAFVKLGDAQRTAKEPEPAAAAADYRKALDLVRAAPPADPDWASVRRRVADAYLALGDDLGKLRKLPEARAAYEESLGLRKTLAAANPKSADVRWDLFQIETKTGEVCRDLNDFRRATDLYLEAVETAKAWLAAEPDSDNAKQNLGHAWDQLAGVCTLQGDLKGAEGYFRKSLEMDEAWLAAQPHSGRAKQMLRYSYADMGKIRFRQGDRDGARTFYAKQLQLCEKWAADEPMDDDARAALTEAYATMARSTYEDFGEAAASRPYWAKVIQRRQEYADANTDNVQARKDLAEAYEWLADVDLQLGDVHGALDDCRKCVELKEEVVAKEDTGETRRNLSFSYLWLGTVSLRAGDVEQAQSSFGKLLEQRQALADAQPGDAQAREDLADAHWRVGSLKLALGDAAAAERAYETARGIRKELLDKNPDSRDAREKLAAAEAALGDARLDVEDHDAARNHYGRARELREALAKEEPDSTSRQTDLAAVLARLAAVDLYALNFKGAARSYGKAAEVLEKLDDAKKLDDKEREALARLKLRAAACERAQAAVDDVQAALKAPADQVDELLRLRAGVLARKGDQDGAAATAAELDKRAGKDGAKLYDLAVCYAQMVRGVARGRPPEQLTDAEQKHRDLYAGRAVDALTRALDGGFTDRGRMLSDPELDVIRPESGYRDLVKSFKPPAEPK